jgi:hypothetical protein
MSIYRFIVSIAAILAFLSTFSPAGLAAGQVQLELVADAPGAALTFQDWSTALAQAGIRNVRLRSATESDKVGIKVIAAEEHPLYVVTGAIISRDELQVPGRRFKRSEAKQLAEWLEDLAENGPPDKRPPKAAFGLTATQLDKVRKDLAAPVGFSTKGLARRELVEKIAANIAAQVKYGDDFAHNSTDVRVEDDFADLSCGTALACLLREAGYGLVPQASGNRIGYEVHRIGPNAKESWPAGRTPEKRLPELLPSLFEFRNINVQDVSAADTLEAIAKRLEMPVVYDRLALARHNIDPATALVTFPHARTNYSLALSRMLFPVGLKFEVRADDAGKPFLWVTAVKPP